eukprot:3715354-Alexandrium_andersonii.AAC.1
MDSADHLGRFAPSPSSHLPAGSRPADTQHYRLCQHRACPELEVATRLALAAKEHMTQWADTAFS